MRDKNKIFSFSDVSSVFYPTRYFAGLPKLNNQSLKPKHTASVALKDMADAESTDSANSTNVTDITTNIGLHAHETNDACRGDAAPDTRSGATDSDSGNHVKNGATPIPDKKKSRPKASARVDNVHIGETDSRTRGRACKQRKYSAALAWKWKWGRWKLSHQGTNVASHVPRPRHAVGNASISTSSRMQTSRHCRFNSGGGSDRMLREAALPGLIAKIANSKATPPVQTFEYHGVTMEQKMLSEAELHINDLL